MEDSKMSSKHFNLITGFFLSLLVSQHAIANEQQILPLQVAKPIESQAFSDERHIQTLAKQVKRLQLEQAKLKLEHERQLLELRLERERLSLENDWQRVKENQLLAQLKSLKNRLVLENTIFEEKKKEKQAELAYERDQLILQNVLAEERNKQQELAFEAELDKMIFKKRLLEAKIAEREKQEKWENHANTSPIYLKEPLVDGQLIISDRKVVLNGPIWRGTANEIVERIQFYNNKNTDYPIFLIIDYCRGGSVMEGTRILKAMHNSRAPVYVVVKSFAASMAAVITTLAERSYAYPDAVIIHHQVWGTSRGNGTEQREYLKILDEWANRIIRPVANKMGITLEAFIDRMYQHNSTGDWFEFADTAIEYKWVDYLIEDIRDTSFVKRPKNDGNDDIKAEGKRAIEAQNRDERGNIYVKMPHLRPFDVYHLYNPDNYYRN
jgi:ATP-dependent Clp protease, protease subunit